MDRLSMSLDDLIAKRETKPKVGKPKGGPQRSTGPIRTAHVQKQQRSEPYQRASEVKKNPIKVTHANIQTNNHKMSVFARLGSAPASGTRVTLKNLKTSVSEKDLYELCASIGEVKDIEKAFTIGDKFTAIVLFSRRSDANSCVSKFHGMTLDGAVMEVFITGEESLYEGNEPVSVFDRLRGSNGNVRQGLFGTAMSNESDDEEVLERPKSRGNQQFSVNLGGGNFRDGGKPKLVQPFSNSDPSRAVHDKPNTSNAKSRVFQEKSRSGGENFLLRTVDSDEDGPHSQQRNRFPRQGARAVQQQKPNDKQRRSGNNRTGGQKSSNPVDLDADLDNYFSSK